MNPNEVLSEAAAVRSSGIAVGLIQHAARKAPAALSERLEEEWLADLEGRHGGFARLRFALGCLWATRVIALELAAPVRAAAATGTATLLDAPGAALFSRRTTVAALIGILHVLVIVGLASGIASEVLQPVSPPLVVDFMPKAPQHPAPPPPSAPAFKQFPPHLPPPIRLNDATAGAGAITVATAEAPPPAAAAPHKQVARVSGGPGRGFPNTADYYPPPSIRLEEKGVASVQVCVDGAGRLTADPVIAQSSGSARLDAGALRLARAGSGHYLPSTEDGRAVSSCYAFGVRFELK